MISSNLYSTSLILSSSWCMLFNPSSDFLVQLLCSPASLILFGMLLYFLFAEIFTLLMLLFFFFTSEVIFRVVILDYLSDKSCNYFSIEFVSRDLS